MEIMDNIRMRMAEKGMKGADMARAIGISTAAFSQWNKGKSKPTIYNLQKVAEVLDCSLDDLLGEKIPMTGFESEADITGAANDAPEDKPKPTVEELVMKAFEDNDMRVLFDKDHGVTPKELIQALKLIEEIKGGRR